MTARGGRQPRRDARGKMKTYPSGAIHDRWRIWGCKKCGCEVSLISFASPVKCHSGCNHYSWHVVLRGGQARTRPLKTGRLVSCPIVR